MDYMNGWIVIMTVYVNCNADLETQISFLNVYIVINIITLWTYNSAYMFSAELDHY